MVAQILDGKKAATYFNQIIAEKINKLQPDTARPKLVIIQVAGDEASNIYVRHKCAIATQIGIEAEHVLLPTEISAAELEEIVQRFNQDSQVNGILLQLPLPTHLPNEHFLNLIHPNKDVDGLTPLNQGLLMQGQASLKSCTPLGIMKLLAHYQINLIGMHAVIVNASKLVGRPLAMELLAAKATVTVCNSKTQHLDQLVSQADIVVAATGTAQIINSQWLKPGCIAIDVGIYRHPQHGLVGDFDFETAKEIAAWITPVPGGVGPMTVSTLMSNVWDAYELSMNK